MLLYVIIGLIVTCQITVVVLLLKNSALKREVAQYRNEHLGTEGYKEELLKNQLQKQHDNLSDFSSYFKNQLDSFHKQFSSFQLLNEDKLEKIRNSVGDNFMHLRKDSSEKLEKIRLTVEEKLYENIENKLSRSFKHVSERLEQLHKGLGEMHTLATGVGDLKKILSNVKTRGTWGEVQLEAILQQVLAPNQYIKDVEMEKGKLLRVDYAVKLPTKDGNFIWLPIDSKFPLDDYQLLLQAQESCDPEQTEFYSKNIERSVKKFAKSIATKYIAPPITTDFAIMFLPLEGMYAEILKNPGIIEKLQEEYRVIITCPTTMIALLNSLQVGFRSMAIEQRASEVWEILNVIKREFTKFAELLSKTKLKLEQATKVIEDVEGKSRKISSKLDSAQVPKNLIDDV